MRPVALAELGLNLTERTPGRRQDFDAMALSDAIVSAGMGHLACFLYLTRAAVHPRSDSRLL